jgi:hypothetical protein
MAIFVDGSRDDAFSADGPQVDHVPGGLGFDVRWPLHPRRVRHGGDDPESFGCEHFPERGGEQRIAVMNQEPRRAGALAQIHGEVAGLLHCPCAGRVRGYPGQVQPAGAVLDEYQHVQPLEKRWLHHRKSQAMIA